MTFYCRSDAKDLYYIASNLIASQIINKPDSILGQAGVFDQDETITDTIENWANKGIVPFDWASLVEYRSKALCNTKVDLLIYGIGKGYKRPRGYEIYQAIQNAKTVLAIATGKENAGILYDALEVDVLSENPVTILRNHANVVICGDEEALSLLSRKNGRWL
ncbi:MAG: hypothetical protein MJ087_05445 [Lachnospiraceae bacterium]|nr:hypothetical protein [Lachnospiraceae bacterium]